MPVSKGKTIGRGRCPVHEEQSGVYFWRLRKDIPEPIGLHMVKHQVQGKFLFQFNLIFPRE